MLCCEIVQIIHTPDRFGFKIIFHQPTSLNRIANETSISLKITGQCKWSSVFKKQNCIYILSSYNCRPDFCMFPQFFVNVFLMIFLWNPGVWGSKVSWPSLLCLAPFRFSNTPFLLGPIQYGTGRCGTVLYSFHYLCPFRADIFLFIFLDYHCPGPKHSEVTQQAPPMDWLVQ